MIDSIKSMIMITGIDAAGNIEFSPRRIVTANIRIDDISVVSKERKYVPTPGDKIYFYPGCDIPRFKVKQFCINNKIALVKTRERSNAQFIGPEVIKNCFFRKWGFRMIKKDLLLAWMQGEGSKFSAAQKSIEDSDMEYVGVNYQSIYDHIIKAYPAFPERYFEVQEGGGDISYEWSGTFVTDDDKLDIITSLATSTQVYDQADVARMLNSGIVMDQKMYDSIHKLFKSEDNGHTVLAMETMANCDFEKSAIYLLLLMREFNSEIYSSKTRNHVNFKALLKFFNITIGGGLSLDQITMALKHRGLLSKENLDILMPMALEQAQENSRLHNYTITKIDITDQLKDQLKENTEIVKEPSEILTPHT